MQELTMKEVEQVNGGNPMLVMAGVFIVRKFGAKAAAFAAGALLAWFAE